MTTRTSVALHLLQAILTRPEPPEGGPADHVALAYEYTDLIMEREVDFISAMDTMHQHDAFTDAGQHAAANDNKND